ncbi:hypothetical protein [Liquorilactobacillus satsumensis]|uniref:hypothetical protein n=1 Tax=Liquorilactobacillus satsumensis TaxID=259059 RepID=UPI0039EC1512
MEANLADGDIPFPSANYFVSAKNSQYKIPAIIAPRMSQLLTFEYMKPGKNTYPIFITFCVDNLNTLYAGTAQSVDQINFLRINLEILLGACTNHRLILAFDP